MTTVDVSTPDRWDAVIIGAGMGGMSAAACA